MNAGRRAVWRRHDLQWLRWLGPLVGAAAALLHVALLLYVMIGRLSYPLDMEWMEGGMLLHALRLLEGQPLYAAPSADFIAYLYTPLYPAVVAAVAQVCGLSYAVGRAVSVLSFAGVGVLAFIAVRRQAGGGKMGALWGLLSLGLMAATFPQTGAWYDLVRNDSLYLLLVSGGLFLVLYHRRWRGLIAAGVLLGLAFLTKQTASLFIVMSGCALLVLRRRRLPVHVAVVGVVAGGAVLVLEWLTSGWFWRYIFEMHQRHELSWARALQMTPRYLLQSSPVVFGVLGLWLLAALIGWLRRRRADPPDAGNLFWFAVALTGVAVACMGFGTQWADKNAFIPGLLFPALFAGIACADLVRRAGGRRRPLAAGLVALVVGGALAMQLVVQRYEPRQYVPTRADHGIARDFLERLRRIEGPVLMPYHPFYPYLVGKRPSYHQMGINDVTSAGYAFPPEINGRIAARHYAAIVLDNHPAYHYRVALQHYRYEHTFRPHEVPRVWTGYLVRPRYVLVPKHAPTTDCWRALLPHSLGDRPSAGTCLREPGPCGAVAPRLHRTPQLAFGLPRRGRHCGTQVL